MNIGAVRKRPMTLLRHLVIAFSIFILGALLRPVSAQLQCDPPHQNWTVASTADATDLSRATNCSGGVFVVTWDDHVVVESEIRVLDGTKLTITGRTSNAIADGARNSSIFQVSNAELRVENMTFRNAYRNGSGGAFLVSSSEVAFSGNNVFDSNHCSRHGGAMHISLSTVTWTGENTFISNTANYSDGLGGALYVSHGELKFSGRTAFDNNECFREGGGIRAAESTIISTGNIEFLKNTAHFDGGGALELGTSTFNATGTLSFVNNFSGYDGGAVRLWRSEFNSRGNASFVDNNSTRLGGAFYATTDSLATVSGSTLFSGNSAVRGGAISLISVSDEPTTLTLQGSTKFSSNRATADGGGLSVMGQGCEVSWGDEMTFEFNTAGNDGGGVAVDGQSKICNTGSTLFFGNSASGSGGAVYSLGNVEGVSFVGATFEHNSAAIGGAIASYRLGQSSANTYINCEFKHNSATSIGGAIEASTGDETIRNSSFVNNSAGTGGALSLSGFVTLENILFRDNAATADGGPAVRNIGTIKSMKNVSFKGNYFVCSEGQFIDFVEHAVNGNQRYEAVCDGCVEWASCDTCHIENSDMEPACFPALDHTSVVAGATLQTLAIDRGYYRATNTSKEILQCYNEAACLGGQSGSSDYCAIGYAGPFCSICQEDYAATQPFTCAPCSGSRRTEVLTIVIVAFLLGGGVVYVIVVHLVTADLREDKIALYCTNTLRRLPRPALTGIKIVVIVWQILTRFSEVANLTYPEAYEELLGILDIFNVDIGSTFSAGCLWNDIDFHDRLLFSTLGPLVTLLLLGITYALALRAAGSMSTESENRIKNKHVSAVLMLTFLVYSSVSSIVFQTFACDALDDGNQYLRADYRILCTDGKHRALQAYAGFMIVVYPFGIPLFYLFLVYRVRSILEDGEARSCNEDAEHIRDLWEPYRPESFYYEVVECLRRIMLTSVVVFIYPGDAAQIAVTIALTFTFFLVSEVLSPYASSWNTWISRIGHIMVFCSFYIALLDKVDISSEREVSQDIFGGVLVAVHVCLVFFVALSGIAHCFSQGPVEVSPDIPVRRTGRSIFSLGAHTDFAGVELFDGIVMTAHTSGTWS